mgnify:CR=1 FL=1
MYNNISVERLQEIEQQRNNTYADNSFQQWMKELGVASMYSDKRLIHNAREAMMEWDSSKLNTHSITITN